MAPEDMMVDIGIRKPFLDYHNLSDVPAMAPRFLDQSSPNVATADPARFTNPSPISTLNLRDQEAQRIQNNYRILLGQTEVAEERGQMALTGEVGRMSKFLAAHSSRFSPEIREKLSGRSGEFKTSHVERHLRGKSTAEKKEILGGVIADADMREAYEEFAEQDRQDRQDRRRPGDTITFEPRTHEAQDRRRPGDTITFEPRTHEARTTRVSPPRPEVRFNNPLQDLHDEVNRIMDAVEEGRDGFEY
jgi:hypothetical protein